MNKQWITLLVLSTQGLLYSQIYSDVTASVVRATPLVSFESPYISIHPYGYVKLDTYFDSRQVVGVQENQELFFPAPYMPDEFGRDINAHPQFTMSPIETRLGLIFTTPEVCGIKTSGVFEADFYGIYDIPVPFVEAYRLYHAMAKIEWKDGQFMFGQFWHPLFIIECFAHTISYNFGAPMEAEARDPQMRLTQRFGPYELIVAAASQVPAFASNGPNGIITDYIRDAVIPNFHLQGRYYVGKHVMGLFGDYKRLVPRLVTNDDIKTNTHIDSFIVGGFAALDFDNTILRMKVIFSQNGNDQSLISGFAVQTRDPLTDRETYTNINAIAGWIDAVQLVHNKKIELAFFAGYTKNLGSRHPLYIDPQTQQPIVYGLTSVGQNLDYVWRISPRILCNLEPVRIGIELEYTRAAFGQLDTFGRPVHAHPVGNARLLTAFYYVF